MSATDDAGATASDEQQITFNVKASNDKKHVLTLSSSATIGDLKTKLSTSEYADLPPERQRLIYSGKVLKDHDTLTGIKIKDGHTIHLVKSAASNARQEPANQGGSATTASTGASNPASNVPTSFATGTANDPLAALTGARYAGFHGLPSADMFGADGGMGPTPNPDEMLRMMENPMFMQQMNEALNNPDVIRMIRNNPMMRDNPMMQAVLENPEMRRALFNPDMIRFQMRMQQAMNGGNGQGGSSFPAPGATDTTPQGAAATPSQGQDANTPQQRNTQSSPPNPFAMFGQGGAGAGGAAGNPFAALFGPQTGATPGNPSPIPSPLGSGNQATQQAQDPNTNTSNSQAPPANPFASLLGGAGQGQDGQANPFAQMTQQIMQNPEAMRSVAEMMQGLNQPGAGGAGANPLGTGAFNPFAMGGLGGLGGMGGFGEQPQQPQDTRPPEERYADQLRQLNEMGFYEFERNVQALRRSGGSVQGAVEYLLSNP